MGYLHTRKDSNGENGNSRDENGNLQLNDFSLQFWYMPPPVFYIKPYTQYKAQQKNDQGGIIHQPGVEIFPG